MKERLSSFVKNPLLLQDGERGILSAGLSRIFSFAGLGSADVPSFGFLYLFSTSSFSEI